MNRCFWLVLVLLVILPGCPSGSTGADTRRYACTQDDECVSGFACLAGMCQRSPGPEGPDAGGGPPTQLGFVTDARTSDTGQCSAAVTLETRTDAGVAAPVASATTITLNAEPAMGLSFFRDAACSMSTTTVTVSVGGSQATFYFRGSTARTVRVTASASGLTSASQDEIIRTGPVSVAFVSAAQTLATRGCSGKVELEARDSGANPVVFSTPRSLTLSGTGLSFFSDEACATPLSNPVFAAGATRSAFYFKGRTSGTITLSAAVSGLSTVRQEQIIRPVVRTGFCDMPSDKYSVTCTISPGQIDLSKTILFVQANPGGTSPDAASLRCWLSAKDALTCGRNQAGVYVYIVWKTVELGSGLKVQQLEPTCQGGNTIPVSIEPVTPSKTFLLVSSEVSGSMLGDNFYTAKLTDTDKVELRFSTACSTAWKGSLQVVEADGIQVYRGTGTMSGTQAAYTSQPAVNLASSALLFTYRVSNVASANLCDRVLRGEMSSSTGVSFSRGAGTTTGCTTAVIDEIAWERIDFGTLAKVQALTVSIGPGENDTQANISSVDESRTVSFASGQAMNGQGGGESAYSGNDLIGESLGAFEFNSSTQLQIARDSGERLARWGVYVVQFEP
ncbi:hypothetical protein [Cystobacter ferrugineus]|uniref:Lipoprotein n=1 Tax=Cystobacter ferrugineus TaxID=83449 RepID=A0A1L9B9L7_9BACT|nr:hypothetical protein [Cystobacter ferrugineus]OJH38893.1 hypothetical protein BON30_21995 [Cystobacter ferrugineus]